MRRLVPDNIVTIAAGGIGSSEQAIGLADAGFDAVVLGRALAVHPEPQKLIRNIRAHVSQAYAPGGLGDALHASKPFTPGDATAP